MIPLFSVEGNIGAGRGALLQRLKELAAAQQVPLFVISTTQLADWLNKLYTDMDKHAFAFQMHALHQQLRPILDAYCHAARTPGAILLTEHSLHSVTSVFTAALQTLNHISPEEASLVSDFSQTLQAVLRLLQIQERGFIFVQSSVRECARRSSLNGDYLSVLDAVYSTMLQTRQLPCFLIEDGYSHEKLCQLLRWMQQKSHP